MIAEALRVLGFVNRFSRGVQRVQDDLVANGNGMPQFDLSLVTAFRVIEHKAHHDETNNETENRTDRKTENRTDGKTENRTSGKTENRTSNRTNKPLRSQPTLSGTRRAVFNLLCLNPLMSYAELQEATGKTRSYVAEILAWLKEQGYITRIGTTRKGKWQILKSLTQH